MLTDPIILTTIDVLASGLKIPAGSDMDPRALLIAMTANESSWGTDCAPRFEPGYYRGGAYFLKPANDWLRDLVRRYGQCAAMSWGPWQIMYPVAYELGYKGSAHAHPWGLYEPEISLHWVIEYLNRRVFAAGALTVAQVGDAYNTGNCRDANHNLEYETDLEAHYVEAVAALTHGKSWMSTT